MLYCEAWVVSYSCICFHCDRPPFDVTRYMTERLYLRTFMKNIFIAEKPSVAQEFAKALHTNMKRKDGYLEGDDAVVTWCVGHLVIRKYTMKGIRNGAFRPCHLSRMNLSMK